MSIKQRHGNIREQTEWQGATCCGKIIYNRRKVAKTFAGFARRRSGDTNIVAYRCTLGHHFHIGHDRPYEERKARKTDLETVATVPGIRPEPRRLPDLVREKQTPISLVGVVVRKLSRRPEGTLCQEEDPLVISL